MEGSHCKLNQRRFFFTAPESSGRSFFVSFTIHPLSLAPLSTFLSPVRYRLLRSPLTPLSFQRGKSRELLARSARAFVVSSFLPRGTRDPSSDLCAKRWREEGRSVSRTFLGCRTHEEVELCVISGNRTLRITFLPVICSYHHSGQ